MSTSFAISTARVRSALAGFPYVADLTIDRDFPDTLRVRMTEYVPAALVLSGGRWYVVASAGRVLAVAPQTGETVAAGSASPGAAASPGANSSPAGVASPPSGTTAATTESPAPGASGSPAAGGSATGATATPSPSSTDLPRPPADVKLPHGTRTLPVIVTAVPLSVGATIADTRVRAELSVLAALPRSLRRSVLGVRATATSIRVLVSGGPTIEFGDTSRLTAKVLALRAVLGALSPAPHRLHLRRRVGARPAARRAAAAGAGRPVGGLHGGRGERRHDRRGQGEPLGHGERRPLTVRGVLPAPSLFDTPRKRPICYEGGVVSCPRQGFGEQKYEQIWCFADDSPQCFNKS